MSNFEIFLIVMFCSVPVLALLMLLPKIKFKKKEKKVEPIKTLAELKEEESKSELKDEILEIKQDKIKENEIKNQVTTNDISTDDFKTYLNQRKNISKPSRVELPSDFRDRTSPYIPSRRIKQEKKPLSVAEEIQNLSPKLKAMIIAGVLDKKDFD